MKTSSSWWVTRGCNYRDVRGRVLSQSASARSVSEPPRKKRICPGWSDFQPCFKQRVALHEEKERERRERKEKLSERRLCIRVNATKTSMRMRVRGERVACFVWRWCSSVREARDPPVFVCFENRTNRSMIRNNHVLVERLRLYYHTRGIISFKLFTMSRALKDSRTSVELADT